MFRHAEFRHFHFHDEYRCVYYRYFRFHFYDYDISMSRAHFADCRNASRDANENTSSPLPRAPRSGSRMAILIIIII